MILDTTKKVGKKVTVCGFVTAVRDHGKIRFIDISDRTGILQTIHSDTNTPVGMQDVLEIIGTINHRPEKMINFDIPTGKVELATSGVKVLEKAHELPFDMGNESLNVSLETLLDYRPLTLRHKKVKAIFNVQEVIADTFRKSLKKLDFKEILVPTIVPTATEGGAEVFPIDYYNGRAFLAQSPQLYKQIMVGVFERVFTIAHAYRAEPSITTRHMSEYVSLDCEFGFINNFSDIMDVVEYVMKSIFNELNLKCKNELKLYNSSAPKLGKEIPRIKMREAQKIILERTGRDNTKESDLTPEDEREICKWSSEKYGSELIFITHYPTKKRPFYTYPDDENPEYTNSFDLLGRGLEWVTGGRRINNYERLLSHIKLWKNKPEDFDIYLQAFKYGMPPEGGFAVGLERVTMQVLGLGNIREASLFPRDMNRVDIKFEKAKDE